MTILTHLVYALAYTIAGLSVGATLPALRPGTDPLTGWLTGAVVVLAGALVHEATTRMERERVAARRMAKLLDAIKVLDEEVARRKAVLEDESRRAASVGYEAMVQEVKLLQTLVAQLARRRGFRGVELRPPAIRRLSVTGRRAPRGIPDDNAPPLDDETVLEAVRDALRADRIDIYLQPIVGLPQRKPCFYELFSRVRMADGHQIMPDRYLAIAKREELIAAIDNQLLVHGVQLLREAEQRQNGAGFFVNVSAATLGDAEVDRKSVLAAQQGLLLKAGKQRFGFGAAVGFDNASQHLHALTLLGVCGLEHGKRLADTGGGAKEHLQPAPAGSRKVSQQRVCAGGITHVSSFRICHSRPKPGRKAAQISVAQLLDLLVQRQHIDHRRADQWVEGGLFLQGLQALHRQLPCRRHTRDLVGHSLRRQVWIKAAARGGEQRLRHGPLLCLEQRSRIALHPLSQRRVAWRQVAGAAGDGSVSTCRRPRMEPAIALEILGDQCRPPHLAMLIAHQATVGLVREGDLGNTRHRQRIQHASQQRHQQSQAQRRANISIHGGLLRPGSVH